MTSPPTLHAIVEGLERLDRPDLEEAAFEYVRGHAQISRLAGAATGAGAGYASDDELTQRIGEMTTRQIAELLAPAAWLAIVAHEQRP
jgi:hypothetical protein